MYGKYRSKTSAGKKRKQYRKRSTGNRKRTGMRKRNYTKNRPVGLSAEKKYIEHGFTSQTFGLYNGSPSNGYYVTQTTPRPIQGLGNNARIGQKIFCTGAIMDVEIYSQANVTNAIRYKYFVVRIPDAYDNPATDIVPAMFDPNPFLTSVYDWHSNLDPEKTSQFKIISKGQGMLKPDSIAGQTSRTQFRKYLKLGFELKWDDTTLASESVKNQWRVILFADTGDTSLTTGMACSMNFRTFYLDN